MSTKKSGKMIRNVFGRRILALGGGVGPGLPITQSKPTPLFPFEAIPWEKGIVV
jgi:hypothetical protein